MTKPAPKITLSASRDIPFDRLVLSQSNVRHVKAGVSIEELAEDIARRTLLASLTVRPILDETGAETGRFEIPAGGRRYRALELLVKQKRLSRTAQVPCIVRTDGLAEEDSLAENVQRAPLHPLDQFRAFQAMRDKGMGEEAIAAAFFVAPAVVRQRLRLAAVSPKLLELYGEDALTLEQLMAFSVNPDPARQEQVWDAVQRSRTREAWHIRRMMTEGAVRAADRRAQFVGLAAYEAAGGVILRDLFQSDDGGWLQDAGLLARLVDDRLRAEAEAVRAEGWAWVETATEFAYGHTHGLRRLTGVARPLDEAEGVTLAALQAEYDAIEAAHAGIDELPDEIDRRLGEIEAAIEALQDRPTLYDPEEMVRAGAYLSLDGAGRLRIDRGYVRPEDEPAPEAEPERPDVDLSAPEGDDIGTGSAGAGATVSPTPSLNGGAAPQAPAEPEEDEAIRPLPDRLVAELTAHRSVALRDALGRDPVMAYLAALHALVLRLFYPYGLDSCLEIEPKSAVFTAQAPGLTDSAPAKAIAARGEAWARVLPRDAAALWDALEDLAPGRREALFAHCVGLTVNAVQEPWNRRPRALAHADRLAGALSLDMAASGWRATVESYLGRVPKARILAAVREARGAEAAERIAQLKKPEMAQAAEALLDGSGWLPEPLRLLVRATPEPIEAPDTVRTQGDDPVGAGDAEAPYTGGDDAATGVGDDPEDPAGIDPAAVSGDSDADAAPITTGIDADSGTDTPDSAETTVDPSDQDAPGDLPDPDVAQTAASGGEPVVVGLRTPGDTDPVAPSHATAAE